MLNTLSLEKKKIYWLVNNHEVLYCWLSTYWETDLILRTKTWEYPTGMWEYEDECNQSTWKCKVFVLCCILADREWIIDKSWGSDYGWQCMPGIVKVFF